MSGDNELKVRYSEPVPTDGVNLKCSFCDKEQRQVEVLIGGPGAYICNECVDLCNDVVNDYRRHRQT